MLDYHFLKTLQALGSIDGFMRITMERRAKPRHGIRGTLRALQLPPTAVGAEFARLVELGRAQQCEAGFECLSRIRVHVVS